MGISYFHFICSLSNPLKNLFRTKSILQIEQEAATGLTDSHDHPEHLKKVLGVRDLTMMGIAAVVGAGIFSTIGTASYDGGPGIVLLFLFVSVACGFSAVCYAEFASMVPVSGSAYTYSYVAFGEIIAWIIGWDLLMEYAIGNIAVAISWSDYFTSFLDNGIQIGSLHLHYHIPEFLTMDYWTAKACESEAAKIAWNNAPVFLGTKIICDIPAFIITAIITAVIYVGIKESKKSANAMVMLKIAVIILVIIAGAFYVQPHNWSPFLPNGLGGVLGGTAAVFFSYIGFDAISTTAEECKNPQRDLPRGMFYSLIICTVVYVLIALVLTGMVSYKELKVGDPLAYVFHINGIDWLAGVISISAVIATASVLLVFQLGQPRIWMSMSRDGLLPPIFSRIHPKYKTPSFSTLLTGFVVGIPALFMNLKEVVDLCSVGTLFAFVLVCGGIIRLQNHPQRLTGKFKTPYINGKWIVPFLLVIGLASVYHFNKIGVEDFLHNRRIKEAASFQKELTQPQSGAIKQYLLSLQATYNTIKENNLIDLNSIQKDVYENAMHRLCFYDEGWIAFRSYFLMWLFLITVTIVAVQSFLKNWSLIPILGFVSCTYLLCESGTSNWERFLVWLIVGLIIYFFYSYKHSKIHRREEAAQKEIC
jgi:amino acid transporter